MKSLDFEALKSFDWRALKKLASPHAADDLNRFLEKLPQNTNQTLLVMAGVVWACAGVTGLYTTVQLQQLTELRAELQEAEAVKPMVPTIINISVDSNSVSEFVERTADIYQGLVMKANGPTVSITGQSTSAFGQFREAIGHVQNGGQGWRVNIDDLCVGRECNRVPLSASLKINKVSVNKPG